MEEETKGSSDIEVTRVINGHRLRKQSGPSVRKTRNNSTPLHWRSLFPLRAIPAQVFHLLALRAFYFLMRVRIDYLRLDLVPDVVLLQRQLWAEG